MSFLTALRRQLAVLPLLALASIAAVSCDQIPAGQTIWVRLSSPVSTYTAKPGDPLEGALTEAIKCDNDTDYPVGTHVSGVVHSVRKVGWGIRHETAGLTLYFDQLQPVDGQAAHFTATVMEVENAREQVSSKGMIQGVLSSDTPEGRITSRLRHLPTWNPYSDMGLIVYKATFPIFPEPEIYLPAGTDIRLKLQKAMTAPPPLPLPAIDSDAFAADDFEWQEFSHGIPVRTTTPAKVDSDLVNLAFVGSREQVVEAFHDAGWVNSDTFTRHSFMRDFYAFLNNSGYAQAPMRPFLLNGTTSDLNWEKSLNSYARRDHLRMWEWNESPNSQTVWLSSSTHDTGAALSIKHHQFMHHISPDIDDERSKVIRDLTAAGCVESVHLIARPAVPTMTQNANGDPVRTDGSLAVVELKNCESPSTELAQVSSPEPYKPGNIVFRYFRRQILTFRSDIWRANIIYGAYDLGRMSFIAIRHHNAEAVQQANAVHPATNVNAVVRAAVPASSSTGPASR